MHWEQIGKSWMVHISTEKHCLSLQSALGSVFTWILDSPRIHQVLDLPLHLPHPWSVPGSSKSRSIPTHHDAYHTGGGLTLVWQVGGQVTWEGTGLCGGRGRGGSGSGVGVTLSGVRGQEYKYAEVRTNCLCDWMGNASRHCTCTNKKLAEARPRWAARSALTRVLAMSVSESST